jgi:hypothetical protein
MSSMSRMGSSDINNAARSLQYRLYGIFFHHNPQSRTRRETVPFACVQMNCF